MAGNTNIRILSNIVIFSGLLFCLAIGCKVKNSRIIPNTYVSFSIDLNQPFYSDLNAVGNAIVVTAQDAGLISLGYKDHGILIYRASEDEFFAFDRTCPYEEDLSQSVIIDNAGDVTAECPECHTEYVLPSYGYPTDKGPGTQPLQMYNTSLTGNYLYVYNK